MVLSVENSTEKIFFNRLDKPYKMSIIKHVNNSSYIESGGNRLEDDELLEPERCEFIHVHEDVVEQVKGNMPDDETLYDLADLFRIFADSTRIKILYVLFESEMCVCDIAQLLGMTQSAISHQLRALKQSKLVKYRREGKTVFYSLADSHVRTILDQGMEHVGE